MALQLVIGNRNYSSWSLRAWLYLEQSGLDFDEVRIPLFVDDWCDKINEHTPAGRVPVLHDGDVTVWDTMAIIAHLRESYPDKAIDWPKDPSARAIARSISYEMHSGFMAIREELPQNLRRCAERGPLSDNGQVQVERVRAIWRECRNRYGDGGAWLFGDFSIADVMYAPVALRFISYCVPLDGRETEFVDAVSTLPAIEQWRAAAVAEAETIDFIDGLMSLDDTPLSLG